MDQSHTCIILTKLFSFEILTYHLIRSNNCPFKIWEFCFSLFITHNTTCCNLIMSRCFHYILHFYDCFRQFRLFSSISNVSTILEQDINVGFILRNAASIYLTVYIFFRTMRLNQFLLKVSHSAGPL